MKKKIVGIFVMTLLIAATVIPVATSVRPVITKKSLGEFTNSISFYQVDFYFENVSQKNSNWGCIQVEILKITQNGNGFLNVYTDAGWVIRNEFIFREVEGFSVLTVYFDLGYPPGEEIKLLSAYVEFTPEPYVEFHDGNRMQYTVADKIYAKVGVGDCSGELPIYLIDPFPFIPTLPTYDYTKPILNSNENVQTAWNQCFPMAIANSLQYLENLYPTYFIVPHDNVKGLKGDNSLVGQLDTYCNRDVTSRTVGYGVWFVPMLQGKFQFLADHGLAGKITHKHQGYGWTELIPAGDFTYAGITSKDESVGGKVTFDWIEKQLRACEDVEIAVRWGSDGGHAVRVYGCGKTMGKPYIRYLDDGIQTSSYGDPHDTLGLEWVKVYVQDLDGDGMLNFGSSNDEIMFALAESVKIIRIYIPPLILSRDIKIKIFNDGDLPLYNITYKIELEGFVLKGKTNEGTISIEPHSEEEIAVKVFGLGPVLIKASTEEDTANGRCFLLGPFVFFLRGED